MFLLVKKNLIINLDQVVSAEYIPACRGIDEETEKPFANDAKLVITLTSQKVSVVSGYEGKTLGSGSASEKIVLLAQEANSVWKYFINPETERVTA